MKRLGGEEKGFLDLLDKLNDDEINQIYEFVRTQKMKLIERISGEIYNRVTIITTRRRVREILLDVANEVENGKV